MLHLSPQRTSESILTTGQRCSFLMTPLPESASSISLFEESPPLTPELPRNEPEYEYFATPELGCKNDQLGAICSPVTRADILQKQLHEGTCLQFASAKALMVLSSEPEDEKTQSKCLNGGIYWNNTTTSTNISKLVTSIAAQSVRKVQAASTSKVAITKTATNCQRTKQCVSPKLVSRIVRLLQQKATRLRNKSKTRKMDRTIIVANNTKY
jgi:hypothetical protein